MITNRDSTKSYKALLTQVSTSHPTVVVLQNNLGVNITWTRESTGTYQGLLGAGQTLPVDEVSTDISQSGALSASSVAHIVIFRSNETTVIVQTATGAGAADGVLENTLVEITIYNQYE